jgi:hypothetical protein
MDYPLEYIAFDNMPALEVLIVDKNRIVQWNKRFLSPHPNLTTFKMR